MVAAMSAEPETMMMESQPFNPFIQYKPSTIISDLIAEGASTDDRTDFSGVFLFPKLHQIMLNMMLKVNYVNCQAVVLKREELSG